MIVSCNTNVSENPCRDVLKGISEQVQKRRVRLSEFFKDGDLLRKGVCSETVFLSAMTQLNIVIKSTEIVHLLNCYRVPLSQKLNYRKFLLDVGSFEVPPALPVVLELPDSKNQERLQNSLNHATTLRSLQDQIYTTRVGIRDLFPDFDPLRKGFCQVSKVKHVFSVLGLSADLDALVGKYGNPDGSFQYDAMCTDIEAGLIGKHLEKDPMSLPPMKTNRCIQTLKQD